MKRIASRAVAGILLCVTALVFAALVAGTTYEAGSSIPQGFAGQVVDVEGVRLRVLQEGAGRDVLMIHGSPGILEDFDAQAAALRGRMRVTRFDRPGHGFSDDTGSYSFEHNARVARALIEKLGLERTIVVGHSYGGSTALALAGLASPRVAAIVVLDSAVYAPIRAVNPTFRYLRLGTLGVGLARLVPDSVLSRRMSEAITAEFVGGPPPGFVDMRMPVYTQPKVMHAVANEHTGSAEELARQHPHYAAIRLPLYIAAQRDDAGRRQAAERLQADVAGAQLELLSPSGHFVQVEHADAVTALIERASRAE